METSIRPAEVTARQPMDTPRQTDAGAPPIVVLAGCDDAVARRQRQLARDSTYRRCLGVADLTGAALTVLAAGLLTDTWIGLPAACVAILAVVPLAKAFGLYDRDENVLNKTSLDEFPRLMLLGFAIALSLELAREAFVPSASPMPATEIILIAVVASSCFVVARTIGRMLAGLGAEPERALVVGDARSAAWFDAKMRALPSVNAVVAGHMMYSGGTGGESLDAATLRRAIDELAIDRLIVCPEGDSPESADLIRAVKSIGVKISVQPRMTEAIGWSMVSDDVAGMPMFGVRDMRMTSSSRFLKRTLDVVGAGLALLLAAPVLAIIAVAVRVDSRGPVFYRQRRIGRGGDGFEIYKFRTMVDGADRMRNELQHLNESSGLFKVSGDPRVTRVGKLLRATSLDELPQLFNVLKGEMSLVGPRPLVPDEDENITGWYRRRSNIKPGITGAWQLLGPRLMPLDEMARIDYLYVANWSLWKDTKILLRTVHHVLARRGV